MPTERLQKLIAHAGLASRREAETLIQQGLVKVNGKVVTELGSSADINTDVILVRNRPMPKPQLVTYALNKPKGIVSSTTAQAKEKLVTDMVPSYPRVYPVGRLDKESEGLILLTNDGDLALRLTHPSFAHEKQYRVVARFEKEREKPLEWLENQIKKGVKLGDGKAIADSVAIKVLPTGDLDLDLVVHEGRLHLVRRMCAVLGLDVRRLTRVRIGTITLNRLHSGDHRVLSAQEISQLA